MFYAEELSYIIGDEQFYEITELDHPDLIKNNSRGELWTQ